MASTALAALHASLDRPVSVRVRRSIRRADVLNGFVVGIGRRWALLHVLNQVTLDGYCAFRVSDMSSAKVQDREDSVPLRALKLNGEQVRPLNVDLDSTEGLLKGLQAEFPLVTIHTEMEHPDECRIGRVGQTTSRTLRLNEIDTNAEWDSGLTSWPLAAITRIEAGGRYECALAALSSGDGP